TGLSAALAHYPSSGILTLRRREGPVTRPLAEARRRTGRQAAGGRAAGATSHATPPEPGAAGYEKRPGPRGCCYEPRVSRPRPPRAGPAPPGRRRGGPSRTRGGRWPRPARG